MNRADALVASIMVLALALAGAPQAFASAQAPESPPVDVPADWWSAVQREIVQSEYHVTRARPLAADPAAGFHAPNRAQNFRTYFTEEGIRVIPRTSHRDEAPAWEWRLALAGWGRQGEPVRAPLGPPQMTAEGNRIEYAWGGLTEWYVNDARGLEQGFKIERRPGAEGNSSGPLRVELAVSGSLTGTLLDEGRAVDFLAPGGARAIRFDHLIVVDADGRRLPAWFERGADPTGAELLAIVVDDGEAAYPITIDPLATSPYWTAEGDQAFADFGYSVATAGDVNGDGYSDVVIGAPLFDNGQADEGRVFVYFGSASGLSVTPNWTAESNQALAYFGQSVATAGDVNGDGFSDVIVGAPSFDNGQTDEGRAYVYHGSPGGLTLTAFWSAESNQGNAAFGVSVATAGDVNGDGFSDVVVGANLFDNGQADEGRAFVYHGSAGGLSLTPNWTAESNQANGQLGFSVSTAGDVNGDGFSDVIVGAWGATLSQTAEGRAFVYHGSAGGLSLFAAWSAVGGQAFADFGSKVASAGDVNGDGFGDVIVGARNFDNGQTNEGRAFVYHGSAGGLSLTAAWTAESDQQDARFGILVATAGDVNGDGFSDVIVGASLFDNGETDEGRAYLYRGSKTGLLPTPDWIAEGDQAGAFFGFSAATAGDVNGDGFGDVIVGAFRLSNGHTGEGRAFVYHGEARGLSSASNWTADGGQTDSRFGSSVATAGDVNGDGFSDVIVGAYSFDNGPSNEGRAFVFHGSAGGLGLTPDWTAEGGQWGSLFGSSVATAGDVNGDGFSDVIVGAFHFDNGESNEGRAFVYHGSAGGLGLAPAWTAESNQAEATFGIRVGTAGDVNGDGYSDVIVGASDFVNAYAYEGRAFVYHGSASGLNLAPDWTADGGQLNGQFGYWVATAGDVNGDGFSDVIVGHPGFEDGESAEGRALVYHGSQSGLSLVPNWTAESNLAGILLGLVVATAGDVNGDGFSDVMVGTPLYGNGQTREGLVFVYHGSSGGLSLGPNWAAESNQPNVEFGHSMSSAGDVNGDGYSDVIVGAPFFNNGEQGEGRAFVYHGSPSGLGLVPNWTAESNHVGAYFGSSVSTAGDVNGDGYSDVIVGAWGLDNEGRVYVFYGNGGGGAAVNPRQARTDDSAPIGLLGTSDSETSFRLKATGFAPADCEKVRLQFEVKPAGVPFDGTGLVTGPEVDAGTPLSELATGLTPGTLYHWRLRILTDSPIFPRSPWFSPPGNAASEADVRTAPSTIAVDDGNVGRLPFVRLEAGIPNPFRSATELSFTLPERGRHRLAVYDVQGREVAVLASGVGQAGTHRLRWSGRDGRGNELPSGVYLLRLESAGQVETRKVVIGR